jgi:hypothetical protein
VLRRFIHWNRNAPEIRGRSDFRTVPFEVPIGLGRMKDYGAHNRSDCFRTSTPTRRNGRVSRFMGMPRASCELRLLSLSLCLARRAIACSARFDIDARLFSAECGSSHSARRGGLADMIGTTCTRPGFFMKRFGTLGLIEYNGKFRD